MVVKSQSSLVKHIIIF